MCWWRPWYKQEYIHMITIGKSYKLYWKSFCLESCRDVHHVLIEQILVHVTVMYIIWDLNSMYIHVLNLFHFHLQFYLSNFVMKVTDVDQGYSWIVLTCKFNSLVGRNLLTWIRNVPDSITRIGNDLIYHVA